MKRISRKREQTEKRPQAAQGSRQLTREPAAQRSPPETSRHQSSRPARNQQLLQLQRTLGNQAVQRLVTGSVQPRLEVGEPNTAYEREANRVAEAVTRDRSEAGSTETDLIQTSPNESVMLEGVRPPVGRLAGVTAPGERVRPLPRPLRAFFEARFERDFRNVRIHTGDHAADAARELDARAFTVGSDITFGAGEYAPGSPSGDRLIAHELAHVVQQSDGVGRMAQRQTLANTAASARERERDYENKLKSIIVLHDGVPLYGDPILAQASMIELVKKRGYDGANRFHKSLGRTYLRKKLNASNGRERLEVAVMQRSYDALNRVLTRTLPPGWEQPEEGPEVTTRVPEPISRLTFSYTLPLAPPLVLADHYGPFTLIREQETWGQGTLTSKEAILPGTMTGMNLRSKLPFIRQEISRELLASEVDFRVDGPPLLRIKGQTYDTTYRPLPNGIELTVNPHIAFSTDDFDFKGKVNYVFRYLVMPNPLAPVFVEVLQTVASGAGAMATAYVLYQAAMKLGPAAFNSVVELLKGLRVPVPSMPVPMIPIILNPEIFEQEMHRGPGDVPPHA